MCNNGHTCDFMTSTCSVCGTTECEMLESDTPCPGLAARSLDVTVSASNALIDNAFMALSPVLVRK